MTTVGLRSMKLASGVAASSMTVTATMTATTMIGTCGVMPTAVMMLSTEKTRSSSKSGRWPTRSCQSRPCRRPCLPCGRSDRHCGGFPWWPSRREEAADDEDDVLPGEGLAEDFEDRSVSCTIQATVPSRPRRMISARPIPMRRAFSRWFSGNLLVRIEMKIRLSIPSTTSMTMRVTSATHAVGSDKRGDDGLHRAGLPFQLRVIFPRN